MTEDRLRRALSEPMTLTQVGPDRYKVETGKDREYEVDLRTMECDCPDFSMRDVDRCKHIYKGLLVTGRLDTEEGNN